MLTKGHFEEESMCFADKHSFEQSLPLMFMSASEVKCDSPVEHFVLSIFIFVPSYF